MAAFADDDDAAAIDAILQQAPSSKIPELLEEASKRGLDVRSDDLLALMTRIHCENTGSSSASRLLIMGATLYIYAATRWGCSPRKRSKPCSRISRGGRDTASRATSIKMMRRPRGGGPSRTALKKKHQDWSAPNVRRSSS